MGKSNVDYYPSSCTEWAQQGEDKSQKAAQAAVVTRAMAKKAEKGRGALEDVRGLFSIPQEPERVCEEERPDRAAAGDGRGRENE